MSETNFVLACQTRSALSEHPFLSKLIDDWGCKLCNLKKCKIFFKGPLILNEYIMSVWDFCFFATFTKPKLCYPSGWVQNLDTLHSQSVWLNLFKPNLSELYQSYQVESKNNTHTSWSCFYSISLAQIPTNKWMV